MERAYLNKSLRKLVVDRSDRLCEYCLIHDDDTVLGCAIDHIISLKHGGPNTADNLAYACVFCNRYKGSDVGLMIWETQEFVRFYNPRRDLWSEHFQLDGVTVKRPGTYPLDIYYHKIRSIPEILIIRLALCYNQTKRRTRC
jgi:hypothetical protein